MFDLSAPAEISWNDRGASIVKILAPATIPADDGSTYQTTFKPHSHSCHIIQQ